MNAPPEPTTDTRPAANDFLELRGLVKRFDSIVAVDLEELDVGKGEFVSLLGPSGSGKTTLLQLIAGHQLLTAGKIRLNSRDISYLRPADRNIGMVFQNYALFPHMSVEKNIAYGLKMRGWPRVERDERVKEMLAIVKLTSLEDRLPRQLSGGQQQRVALARALAPNPSILLMDEPLGALDRELRVEMMGELRRIHWELGTTVVFVTHEREEALTLSDRVVVMRSGKMVAVDEPRALYERPLSAFVAKFIGGHNLFSMSQLERSIAPRLRELLLEKVAARMDIANSKLLLAVRPNHIILDAADDAIPIQGRIEDVQYWGERSEITVSHSRLGRIVCRTNPVDSSNSSLRRGAEIKLHIDCANAVLVKDDLSL